MTKGNGNLRGKARRHLFQYTGFTALIYLNRICNTLKICSLSLACYKWDERKVGRFFYANLASGKDCKTRPFTKFGNDVGALKNTHCKWKRLACFKIKHLKFRSLDEYKSRSLLERSGSLSISFMRLSHAYSPESARPLR